MLRRNPAHELDQHPLPGRTTQRNRQGDPPRPKSNREACSTDRHRPQLGPLRNSAVAAVSRYACSLM
jgi:hypothetical protein